VRQRMTGQEPDSDERAGGWGASDSERLLSDDKLKLNGGNVGAALLWKREERSPLWTL